MLSLENIFPLYLIITGSYTFHSLSLHLHLPLILIQLYSFSPTSIFSFPLLLFPPHLYISSFLPLYSPSPSFHFQSILFYHTPSLFHHSYFHLLLLFPFLPFSFEFFHDTHSPSPYFFALTFIFSLPPPPFIHFQSPHLFLPS